MKQNVSYIVRVELNGETQEEILFHKGLLRSHLRAMLELYARIGDVYIDHYQVDCNLCGEDDERYSV